MKDKDFKDLLKSIDQARAIHKDRLRPRRVIKEKAVQYFIKLTPQDI